MSPKIMMFGYLILLLTILPALELAVLIHIGSYIGAGNTFLIIILTGITGAYLAKLQGFFVIHNIQSQVEQGIMPTEDMLDGLLILGGAILLLTPGFITDIFGFLLLIPLTRTMIKIIIRQKFQNALYREGHAPHHHPHRNRATYIDAEDADIIE